MGGQILTNGRVDCSWQWNCRASLDWTTEGGCPHIEHRGEFSQQLPPPNHSAPHLMLRRKQP